jgi:hypothetical protein
MFTDPYAKLCLTSLFTRSFRKTFYLDLDTTFTAYLQAGLIKTAGKVDSMVPTESRLVPMIQETISSLEEGSLVIFDSVNSFYSLFNTNMRNLGALNHLLSVLLMLLVKSGSDSGVPIVATSMLRYRHAGGWVQSPASKRLLQNKSAVKMKVDMTASGDLAMSVMEHDSILPGKEFILADRPVTATPTSMNPISSAIPMAPNPETRSACWALWFEDLPDWYNINAPPIPMNSRRVKTTVSPVV